MVVPTIIGFLVFAVIGAGNPSIDEGLDKLQAPYPVITTNSSTTWCVDWLGGACFGLDELDWLNVVPGWFNTTMTRMEGLEQVRAETLNPQNFTVVGQTVNVGSIDYIWGFLVLIFAIGAFIQGAELVRGN